MSYKRGGGLVNIHFVDNVLGIEGIKTDMLP